MSGDPKIDSGAPMPGQTVLPSYEHKEGSNVSPKDMSEDDIFAEDVAYGPQGLRGLVGSGYVFGAAALASLGGFSFGYDQGVISIINVMDQFHDAYPRTDTAFGTSFMTAMLLFGAFVGCLFMPYFADKFSRKRALTAVVIIFDIGAIIQTVSKNYATLVVGRAIGGIGVGTLAMGAPLYISEISPPNLRGSLLVLESISIVSGVVISFWITYGTRTIDSEASFRLPLGLQMVCATILGVCIQFFPYSPRWLTLVGRNEECLASLSKLRALPVSDPRLQKEFKGIVAEVEFNRLSLEQKHPGASAVRLEVLSWLDLFDAKMMRRTLVGCGVCFFQQFSGINAFIYYAPTLFRSIGQSDEMSLILSGVFNILQLVAVAICFVVIDKVGRRPLAIIGGFGSGACYVVIAALSGVYSKDWSANTSAGWACVAMAFCFIMVYGVSYSPLGWSLPAEVFPNSKRAKGVALATCVNWLCNFTVGIASPPMLENIHYGTYIFFASFCMLSGVWALLLVPETKGKTLEEIDIMFGDTSSREEKDIMRVAAAKAEEVLASHLHV
ncbi:general substrate transporter [Coniochaeta ligniaria NRRL 30616]|uniref:General substrate transporter n=1 Tax=Coniochaeta ligniaria NRRL 30616 TaxID=1408157 RepID=A0A1J7IXV6_9PEZI|nr:general substrate transporter [Coniochaeta ligniaria NRRL 30616]